MEAESITIRTTKNTYTGKINKPDLEDAYVSYGDLKPKNEGANELEGMDLKANFWLLTGARGGKVILGKGDQQADYFVRPPKK